MSNTNTGLVPAQPQGVEAYVDAFSKALHQYLDQLGIPSQNVLVEVDQRGRILGNLPAVVGALSPEQRQAALYLSKMVAACGAGLFDAALNFLWDEVVSNLRTKILQFDLEYFFDTAVKDPTERKKFSSEEDLRELDDWTLVKGSHACGIITEIGYRHLDYIRGMRNWASAAHPNQYQLTGFQLLSWLETCITEVIARPIAGAVVEVRRLLRNVREQTLTANDVAPIAASIATLPADLATALLRSTFGLYTDPKTDVRVKNNVRLVAPAIWGCTPDNVRYEVGLKFASFSVNGDIARRDLAREFLEGVQGLTYIPASMLALEFQQKVDALETAHNGWDNFYHEASAVRDLRKLIPPTGEIPQGSNEQYVKVLVLCMLGNGYGVSRAAMPTYEEMLGLFQQAQIVAFVKTLRDVQVAGRLQQTSAANRFQQIAATLAAKTTTPGLGAVLTAIRTATAQQIPNLGKDTGFQRLLSQI